MSFYTFKVQVLLHQNVLDNFYHRQSADRINSSLKTFRNNLFERYRIETPIKVTWIDNDGDIINVFNDEDLHTFMRLKGTKVIVNVDQDFVSTEVDGNSVGVEDINVNDCESTTNEDIILTALNLQQIIENAATHDSDMQMAAVRALRKMIASDLDTDRSSPISSDVSQILMTCLKRDDYSILQFEAAYSIITFISNTCKQGNQVATASAVPLLVQLLTSSVRSVPTITKGLRNLQMYMEMPACTYVCVAAHLVEQAVLKLHNIIDGSPQQRDYVIELGIVQPLLKLVMSDIPTSLLKEVALAIRKLCSHKKAAPIKTILDMLPALKILFQHTDVNILKNAADALSGMVRIGIEQIQMVIDSDFVSKLVPLLAHSDVEVQESVLYAVGNISCGTDKQIQVVLNCGALSYLSALLSHPTEEIVENALWVLYNMTVGSGSQIDHQVINTGLLLKVIEKMRTGSFQTQTTAAEVIGSIAVKNSKQRNEVVKAGALPILLQVITSSIHSVIEPSGKKSDIPTSLLKVVLLVIKNLCCHKEAASTQTILDIMAALNVLIQHTDMNILIHAVNALSSWVHFENEQLQMVIDSDVVPKLVPLLAHGEVDVQKAVLDAICNISCGSEDRIQALLNCGALSHFPPLLSHPKEEIVESALCVLHNITAGAGTKLQVQAIIDAGLLSEIIENMRTRTGHIVTMAPRAISYIRYVETVVQQLVKDNVIPSFRDISKCKDLHLIKVVLVGINDLLKAEGPHFKRITKKINECGCVVTIEEFQKLLLLGESLAHEIKGKLGF